MDELDFLLKKKKIEPVFLFVCLLLCLDLCDEHAVLGDLSCGILLFVRL